MIKPTHQIGHHFPIQFVWELPNGDFLRAIFETTVIDHHHDTARYLLTLDKFAAGRQEAPNGQMRPREAIDPHHWQLVHNLVGRKIDLAYETDDNRPIRLKLNTLTLEHKFFTRYE